MRHLDLFSGIGGFALAAKWVGWETTQFVEIDRSCQKILKKNFPTIPIHDDIKTFKAKDCAGAVDIITAGFPCQPFSVAGKQKGKDDNRYLWPELIKTIRVVKPTFVVCENVPGIIKMAFETVCTDLEKEGYQVETFIIPACGVGAIHKRNRVWIIAYANRRCRPKHKLQTGRNMFKTWNNDDAPNTNSKRLQKRLSKSRMEKKKAGGYQGENTSICNAWPTQSPICRRDDGIPNRVDRIKALGNSIVPQIAYEIFLSIKHIYEPYQI